MSKYLCPYCNIEVDGQKLIDYLDHYQIEHDSSIISTTKLIQHLKEDGITIRELYVKNRNYLSGN